MNDDDTTVPSRRKSRAQRVRLRKHQELDHVRVQEAWSFCRQQQQQQQQQHDDDDKDGKVGEACFVTATVQNRRYHGVLVEQEALQAASNMYWQDQATSLDLNRRMLALQQAGNGGGNGNKNNNNNNNNNNATATERTMTNKNEDKATPVANPQTLTIFADKDDRAANQTKSGDKDTQRQQQNGIMMTDTISNTQQENSSSSSSSSFHAKSPAIMDDAPPQQEATTRAPTISTQLSTTSTTLGTRKRPRRLSNDKDDDTTKFVHVATAMTTTSADSHRPVQKFAFDAGTNTRNLLATYVNVGAAGMDNENDAGGDKIQKVCNDGGGFVGRFYYQYEMTRRVLQIPQHLLRHHASLDANQVGINTNLSMGTFLQSTAWPTWYPLSNYSAGGQQQQVLDSLGLSKRKDSTGAMASNYNNTGVSSLLLPPMAQARSHYQVIILGAGIAGLSAALELFRETERLGISVHVTILEARNRVGGRLWTDRETFMVQTRDHDCDDTDRSNNGVKPFPVDLGAGWIHGIDMNPLASVAKQAGVDFVTTSEELTMLDAGHSRTVDADKDERAGKVFDQLLDLAVEDCWKSSTTGDTKDNAKTQAAVRWYGSILRSPATNGESAVRTVPVREPPASHRVSNDVSVDQAIGKIIRDVKTSQMAQLHEQERRMLLWNLKNTEYALGANLRDLSMRYWDIDERHAFGGDHVLLRQGYSTVAEYLVKQLEQRGESFELIRGAPVKKVEYNRKSASIPYFSTKTTSSMIELSDACKISTESTVRPEVHGDFVVCALPLGVLKEAVSKETDEGVQFDPPLPFPKVDAIQSVGFGLLNKVYLQFPVAFWRLPGIVDEDTAQFGNASPCNPHHYMFFDMGKIMALDNHVTESTPAILMTLISGHEAVVCEQMDEPEVLGDVLATLQTIFQGVEIPAPISYQITKWGTDEFSRGSYTYLPPGCTDQDFHVLQAPVNGNGDSTLLETAETYRVFFAGEHTTALHPSMAHGAMLSGYRAAKEVISNMSHSLQPNVDIDRTIPLSIFRYQFPNASLVCSLCGVAGSTVREGTLLAFKRGPRAILVHNNCVEYSPEVEIIEGVWKFVFQCCNRGKDIACDLCGKLGATIGCAFDARCQKSYHFSCAENTGYRFDRDSEGKEFFCDVHRRGLGVWKESRRISLDFFKAINYDGYPIVCSLCGISESRETGGLLCYQQGYRRCLIHKNCAKYSTVVDISEDSSSRLTQDYRNVFAVLDKSKECSRCSRPGATIGCSYESCQMSYHYLCAVGLNWDFDKWARFRCPIHRQKRPAFQSNEESAVKNETPASDLFQHALFSQASGDKGEDIPANQVTGARAMETEADKADEDSYFTDEVSEAVIKSVPADPITQQLCNMKDHVVDSRLVGIQRSSPHDYWNLTLCVAKDKERDIFYVSFAKEYQGDGCDVIEQGEVLVAINGVRVGMPLLKSMEDVLDLLKQEVELLVEVQNSFPSQNIASFS